MKKFTLLILLLLGLSYLLKSQTVDNIKVEQAGDVIKIHYQILNSTPSQVFRVTVLCSINGGLESVLKSLSGDFGDNVVGGRAEYMVLWDVLKDVDEVNSVDFSVRAELLKDDTPITNSTNKIDWSKERFHTIFTWGQYSDNGAIGIRFAYMGSWGISGKYLFWRAEKIEKPNESTTIFHYGLDLTKRIVNEDGFSIHLLAGFNYGKLELFEQDKSSFYNNRITYELGTIIAYKRLVISFAYAPYSSENLVFYQGGLGIRL